MFVSQADSSLVFPPRVLFSPANCLTFILRKAMKHPIRIDFVSDIACPWCAVGLSSLQLALSRLGDTVDAELVVHPFELNPRMGEEGEDLVEHIGKKYGRTPQQIAQ